MTASDLLTPNGVSLATEMAGVDSRVVIAETNVEQLRLGQQSGVMVYQTKALLDAYTPTTEQELGSFKVTNDSTMESNGYYSWNGSAFVKDTGLVTGTIDVNNTTDAVSGNAVSTYHSTVITEDIVTNSDLAFNLASRSAKATVDLKLKTNGEYYGDDLIPEDYKLSSGEYTKPVVIDADGNVAVAVNSKGELICRLAPEVLRNINMSQVDPTIAGYILAAVDAAGNVAGGISSDGKLCVGRYNMFDAPTPDSPDVVFSLQDELGNSALTIYSDGSINSSEEVLIPPAIAEINQTVLHGQSLSVGARGVPIITVSQPYHNLMFNGGTRPASYLNLFYERMESFIPLTETEAGIFGETCLSGALNYATELYRDEEGIIPTPDLAMLGVSTGLGDTSILNLGVGSGSWNIVTESLVYANLRAAENDKSHVVQSMLWMQGEHDANLETMTQEIYITKLLAMQRDFSDLSKSITKQVHSVPLISYQQYYALKVNVPDHPAISKHL